MRLLFVVVAAGGLLLDQLTKIIAVRWLDPADPPVLLGGLLTLRLIRNPGAAFSLGENFTMEFALLADGVAAGEVYDISRTSRSSPSPTCASPRPRS